MKKIIIAALLALGIGNANAAGYMDVLGCDGLPFMTVAVTDDGHFLVASMEVFMQDFSYGAIAAEAFTQAKEQGNVFDFDFRVLIPEVCADAIKESESPSEAQ